jgi:ribosome biogenesis protein SSF1/2
VPPPGTVRDKVPRSLVFRRGKIPAGVRDLVPDVRRMFMPNTALNLKERKFNNIRDYVSVSAQLGVSHFWVFSATDRAPYIRFAKVPQGPTLTFRLLEYSLAADVRAAQRRPVTLQDGDFTHPPLLVLNNFATPAGAAAGANGVKLMAEMFRKSFPAVDVKEARLKDMHRVILIDRDEDEDVVRVRHYAVRVQAAGLSKNVRKLTVRHKVPKLANMVDVAELVDANGAFSSDSEVDNTPIPVTLPQAVRRLRTGASSSVRLVEVGPRLTLRLIKAQGGLCEGSVLYHRHVVKDEGAVADAETRIKQREALKRKRRAEQAENVNKKQSAKRAKKERYKERLEGRLKAEHYAESGD